MTVLFFVLAILALAFSIWKSLSATAGVLHFKMSAWFFLPAALFFLFLSTTQVSAGKSDVVTRFGKVSRVISPGLHLVVPFVESVYDINTQTQTVKPSEDAASNDLQIVHTEVTLAYHYDPTYTGFIYEQLGENAKDNVIVPAILEAIKSKTAQYSASDLIAKRPQVRDGIDEFVKARLANYHIIVETVSITDFHFSGDYEKAIESKVTAVQRAEQAQNDLNRIKIEAEQKVAAAQGEANALRVQKEQITAELLSLRTIEMMREKWDGRLPETIVSSGQSPIPMMDVLKGKHK